MVGSGRRWPTDTVATPFSILVQRTAQRTSRPTAIQYRGDIDGLRAAAVILVLGFHAFPHFVPGGFIGVDVFFVISGFLITSIIVSDTFTYKHFYANRVRRIFPALALVLAFAFAMGWMLLDPEEMTRLSKSIVASSIFIPNFQFWSEAGYFDAAAETKPLLHLWSLGVEEQFYLVWPLFLGVLIRFKHPILAALILVTLVSFAVGFLLSFRDPTAAFYAPWARAWELSLGGVLAALNLRYGHLGNDVAGYRTAIVGVTAVLAISAAALWSGSTSPLPHLVASGGAAALIWAGPRGIVGRLLGGKVLVAVGLISYPLYLWHWPILVFARLHNGGSISAAQTLTCLAGSFFLAAASYWLIERPIRFGTWNRWSVVPLVGAIVLLGTVSFAGVSTQGFALRFPEEVRDVLAYGHYEYAKEGRALDCWIRTGDPFEAFNSKCFLKSPTAGGKTVIVWGDSHAARLYAGMRPTLSSDIDIAQFTKDSCPPLLNFAGPCGESNRAVLDEIRHGHPDTVVLFAAWGFYGDWKEGTQLDGDLAATIAGIKAAGPARIVVVGPAPRWSDALPKLVYYAWLNGGKELPDRLSGGFSPDTFATNNRISAIAKAADADYVSLVDLLCKDAGCLTHVPGNLSKLTSWDYGHLTTDGAALVTKYLVERQLLP
ncbi:acyltransferase family protein [Mesorhizobium sp. M1406]|uniref:acyltransferase family protein n=1 Tax=Mesorhizobium sp. M1406 TaxID=2957099 RepID=UPI00333A2F4C